MKGILKAGLASYADVDPDQSLLRATESSAVDLGDLYRQFMGRLIKFRGRAAADELVHEAVLAAWEGPNAPEGDGLADADLQYWQLTDGLVALSEIVAARRESVGSIVTTNFDPLIEVALRRAGLSTRRWVVTADAPLGLGPAHSDPETIDVVYVHGFWYSAPTMHSPEQLMYSRPRLQAAISRAIEQSDALVLGYGGWDDVVTGALEALTLDDGAATEVMWCFYESDESVLQARNRTLLGRVGRLVVEGLFHRYAGIDCHHLLPALSAAINTGLPATMSPMAATTPRGWANVDEALVAGAQALHSEQDLRAYFDGRQPDWAIVSLSQVPRLSIVNKICSKLLDANQEVSIWQFVIAAAGDGKSTSLMQVAFRMYEEGWRVVWRPHPGTVLAVSDLLALVDDRPTLVVVDDADNCVEQLSELASTLAGKQLHLVAAARLADWRNAAGDVRAFAHVAATEMSFGALSRHEGREIVDCWSSVPNGLGTLSDEREDARVERLLSAVEADRRSNGSLLGGLFRLRFDKSRLDAHVSDLLSSLEKHELSGTHVSLLKAFIYVAAMEVGGVEGIDRRLWAELLGVDVKSLRRTVEFSLGTEAATARAGGIVQVRHPEIARSAIRLLRSRDRGIDLSVVFGDIVESTISLGRYMQIRDYSKVVHLATKIADGLQDVGYQKRPALDIAILAARRSVEAEPGLLVYQTDLGSLLRKNGLSDAAIDLYEDANERLRHFRDRHRAAPGFFYDWAIAYLDNLDPRSSLATGDVAMMSEGGSLNRVDAGKYFVLFSRCFLRIYRETSSDRARLSLAGVTRLAQLALVSAEDLNTCLTNAAQAHAPTAAGLSSERAMQLLEKGITELSHQSVAAALLPSVTSGRIENTLGRLLSKER